MNERKNERKPLPGYQVMALCQRCAEKLGKLRPMEDAEGREICIECSLCWRRVNGKLYKVFPQPKVRYRSTVGGGERARAGRR